MALHDYDERRPNQPTLYQISGEGLAVARLFVVAWVVAGVVDQVLNQIRLISSDREKYNGEGEREIPKIKNDTFLVKRSHIKVQLSKEHTKGAASKKHHPAEVASLSKPQASPPGFGG
jgi:hypothetical protein